MQWSLFKQFLLAQEQESPFLSTRLHIAVTLQYEDVFLLRPENEANAEHDQPISGNTEERPGHDISQQTTQAS